MKRFIFVRTVRKISYSGMLPARQPERRDNPLNETNLETVERARKHLVNNDSAKRCILADCLGSDQERSDEMAKADSEGRTLHEKVTDEPRDEGKWLCEEW